MAVPAAEGAPPSAYPAGGVPQSAYGVYGAQMPPQSWHPGATVPPNSAYGAGVPPVYTCPTPAQPYYQHQQQAAPTYYVSAPPPAAYPYQQHHDPIKPEVLGKPGSGFGAGDLEKGNVAEVNNASGISNMITEDLDVSIRHAFVRKVYCIVGVQVLVTFGLALAFSLSVVMRVWLAQNWWIALVGLLVAFVCMITISCVPSLGRRFPVNFIFLSLITLGFSMAICLGSAATSSYSFFLACGITAAVVVALTLFAVQVKYDFTGWGPYILVAVIVLFIVGILCLIFSNRISACIYAGLGAVVFSFVLVYDTQQVVGGKHRKYQYSLDDYIFAALTLYLDIVLLFMYILSLLNNT